jgi:addiction module HigA family antidote
MLTIEIIIRRIAMLQTREPTRPGVVFFEDVLKPLNLSITEAAAMLGVTRKALSEFINGKSALSPQMALRIAEATDTSPESWLNMQLKCTLWKARSNVAPVVQKFPELALATA